jgi:deoxyribodipyrimidine photo-lyase
MQFALVWIRKDIRLHDNECFELAIDNGFSVLPVFVDCSTLKPSDEYLPEPRASFREHFLAESLHELHEAIRRAGGKGLIVIDGKPQETIPELCKKYNIAKVYFAAEPGPFEQSQESALVQALMHESIPFETVHHNSMFSPESLPFQVQDIPDIFTEFRKKAERSLPLPRDKKDTNKIHFANHEEVVYQSILPEGKKSKFSGGESEALKRLNYYLFESNLIASYKETRNGLLGEDFSSRFSPWLALGCISPKRILFEIKNYEREVVANESTYWLVFELLWREYFRWIMYKYETKFFRPSGIKKECPQQQEDAGRLEKWKKGETGQAFVDAAMRELNETGFMSNRARQNVASYLVHDLKQNWLEGARYFEQLLVDYDVSSNYGNWAYVAGVGNDPRPNRYFNVNRQAEMYDPDGLFVKHWLK